MTEVTLHRVRPDEWEQHRALRLEMLLDAPDAFWTSHDDAAALDEAAWRDRIGATYHVQAHLDGQPVGSVGMWDGPEPDGVESHLIAMYVAPRARGQRVGERLVQAVLDEARRRGLQRVVLRVTSNNSAAMSLYERMGFSHTGNRTQHPRRADLEELEMVADLGATARTDSRR